MVICEKDGILEVPNWDLQKYLDKAYYVLVRKEASTIVMPLYDFRFNREVPIRSREIRPGAGMFRSGLGIF